MCLFTGYWIPLSKLKSIRNLAVYVKIQYKKDLNCLKKRLLPKMADFIKQENWKNLI